MKKSIILYALISSGLWFALNSMTSNNDQSTKASSQLNAEDCEVPSVKNPITGRIWMDRNLGADRVATSKTDVQAYGDLYQWGRATDGHQLRNSATTTTLATSLNPGHDQFIVNPDIQQSDWRSNPNAKQNALAWTGVTAVNNPCPCGFRIPTVEEWEEEMATWPAGATQTERAFNSLLKLPSAGVRVGRTGQIMHIGESSSYWTSYANGSTASLLTFSAGELAIKTIPIAYGESVRCIKKRAKEPTK